MARKKDLAGLATLAGLAYMASRDKGGEPADVTATEESVTTSPVRSGEVEETTLDRAADIPRSRPTATRATAPASPSAGGGRGRMGGPTAAQAASNAGLASKPTYETPYDRSRREDREAGRDFDSLVGSLKDRIATAGERGRALPLKSTKADKNEFMGSTGLKKGGSVKGWGIARGARKAKTY